MKNSSKLLFAAVFAVVVGLLAVGCKDPASPGGKAAVPVTSVTLDQKTLKLTVGDKAVTLIATVLPETATDKSVTWESSDETIATVTKGKVTPVAIGQTKITVTTNSGGKTAECKVTVSGKPDSENPDTVDSVTLDQNTLELVVGDTAYLTAFVEPETAADQSVTWESSDETIATVTDDGEVTAIAAGEAIISVITNDGGFIDDCIVTVTDNNDPGAVTGVTLNQNALELVVGGTETLIATVQPQTATNKTVTWSTSAAGVATVANGTVTAVTDGTAIITVTTTDGSHTAQCTVTVTTESGNPAPIPVTGVTLSQNTLNLAVGGTAPLTATVQPETATNKAVTWNSSNTAIATITNGTVTAVAAGTATITVTTTDGSHTANCTVTVIAGIDPGLPLPPVELDNIKQITGGIEIKYDAVPNAASYTISRAGSRLGTYTQVGTSATTTFTDTNPNANRYENYYRVQALNGSGGNVGTVQLVSFELSMFGKDMRFYDIKYDNVTAIRTEINDLHDTETWHGHWINNRYGLYFKPGTYTLGAALKIGFYTQAAGLGKVPSETKLAGGIDAPAHLNSDPGNQNVTQNFWRVIENLEISSGQFRWSVSQAAPARRMKVMGNAVFDYNGGWASGGFLSDSHFAGNAGSSSQQQWYARNCHFTTAFSGVNWNKVIQASSGQVEADNATGSRTRIENSPIIREKPFLYMENGEYKVFVPAIKTNAVGVTWTDANMGEGRSLDLVQTFYIARADKDTAATINTALAGGKHIFFSPGRYELSTPLRITRPDTVVLGTALATLIPAQGNTYGAIYIDDVDNVTVAGLMFDALYNSTYLICAGGNGANANHSAAPTLLSDLFFRVGGVRANCNADISALINSNNVIGDHFWVWRADHGTGVGWTSNRGKNGVVVKGNDVTFYGLFVEHYQEYETLWIGENGRCYFYQNEKPYDPPNQAAYMSHNGTVNGWAAYKVANTVNNHLARGLGVYPVFRNQVWVANGIEVPNKAGVRIERVCTVRISNNGGVSSVVNGAGPSTAGGNMNKYLLTYSNGVATGTPPLQGNQPADEVFTLPTNLVP